MANSDVIKAKASFDALQSMTDTVRAFSDLVDVIPRDDSLSSLLRILSERLEGICFRYGRSFLVSGLRFQILIRRMDGLRPVLRYRHATDVYIVPACAAYVKKMT